MCDKAMIHCDSQVILQGLRDADFGQKWHTGKTTGQHPLITRKSPGQVYPPNHTLNSATFSVPASS